MEINKSKLPNGLEVISINIPYLLTTSIAVVIKSGKLNEKQNQHGIAHFTEHMLFKGTKKRNAFDISAEIEQLGSRINAYTSNTETVYYVTGLTEYLTKHINILSDIVINSKFDEKDIELEKNVIKQEIKTYLDDPMESSRTLLNLINFGKENIYSKEILGTNESVSSFNHDDFIKFTNEHYTSNNMFIIAIGNISHDQLVIEVSNAFSKLSINKKENINPDITINGGLMFHDNSHYEQISLLMGFNAFHDKHELFTASEIFMNAFGKGMSSPLFQEIREKRGLVYGIGSYLDTDVRVGRYVIYSKTTGEHIEDVMSITMDELRKIANDGIKDEDFKRAKNNYKVRLSILHQDPESLLYNVADSIIVHDKIISIQDQILKAKRVKKDDIRKVAEHFLTSKIAIAMTGPIPNKLIDNLDN